MNSRKRLAPARVQRLASSLIFIKRKLVAIPCGIVVENLSVSLLLDLPNNQQDQRSKFFFLHRVCLLGSPTTIALIGPPPIDLIPSVGSPPS
jgi:hypothetical protein